MKNLKLEKLSGLDFRWHPERAVKGPMSIVISEADRQVVVFRNGEPIGRARFEIQGSYHFPTAIFSYLGRDNNQNRWLGVWSRCGGNGKDAGCFAFACRGRARLSGFRTERIATGRVT